MREWPEMLAAVRDQLTAFAGEIETRMTAENWAAGCESESLSEWRSRAINMRWLWLKVKGRHDKTAKKTVQLQSELTSARAHLANMTAERDAERKIVEVSSEATLRKIREWSSASYKHRTGAEGAFRYITQLVDEALAPVKEPSETAGELASHDTKGGSK